MEIKLAQSPADLKGLLTLSDDTEQTLDCSRAEWVQWIMQEVGAKNQKLAVWVIREEGTFKGYIVAMDTVYPPLFYSICIIYTYLPNLLNKNRDLLFNTVEDWARSRGARRMDTNTRVPDFFCRYGFVNTGYTLIYKNL